VAVRRRLEMSGKTPKSEKQKTWPINILVIVTAIYCLGAFLSGSWVWLQRPEWITPSRMLVKRLDSADGDVVRGTLFILEHRRSPAGREKALGLLKSEDDYIWFNAALYLSAISDANSIPYLIKGLRHPAYMSRDEVESDLLKLTGQPFGGDQSAWIKWWQDSRPESGFDFRYARDRE
jgi:hypothetical protein